MKFKSDEVYGYIDMAGRLSRSGKRVLLGRQALLGSWSAFSRWPPPSELAGESCIMLGCERAGRRYAQQGRQFVRDHVMKRFFSGSC